MHIFYFLLYFFLPTTSKKIEIMCPQHCKCDFFEKLKRASCNNQKIAHIESNFPQQTEVLDLSYNIIKKLDDQVFENEKLVALKLLNISHNSIGEIHMNAFQSLKFLKTLDLSFNRIQYILENWFWSLNSLQELYLKGNSFSRLDKGPIFESATLKILDLSECHISYIGKDTFTKMKNLEILDISNNYLINFYVATIEPLPDLKILNLDNMKQLCEGQFKKLETYSKEKGIKVITICGKIKKNDSAKFQRMINLDHADNEKNAWIYDDEEVINTDNETQTSCNNTQIDKSLLQEIVNLSPILSVLIPFIYGIAIGILIAFSSHICLDKRKNLEASQTSRNFRQRINRISSRLSRNFSNQEDRQNLPLTEYSMSESTPVLSRRNL